MEISSLFSNKSLDTIFKEVSVIYKSLENTQFNSNDERYQAIVNNGIELSKLLWTRVQDLELFSQNEQVEDLATESLKYAIIPGMIGHFLYLKMDNARLNVLKDVEKYYQIFMELMSDYGLQNADSSKSLMNESRENKIKHFKESQIVKQRLIFLEKYIEEIHVDEEIKREYYLTLTKQWVLNVSRDFKLIQDELFILENKNDIKEPPVIEKEKMKSFVITKNMVQNTVFGVGYKNLPTYSIDDFYNMQVEQGQIPTNESIKPIGGDGYRRVIPDINAEDELEAEKEDILEDNHDDNSRMKKMYWDNYKDDNRRGCGNTSYRG